MKEPGDIEIYDQDVFVKTGTDVLKLQDIEIEGKRMRDSQVSEYFKTGKAARLI
jgi:hypothetical protein